MFDHPIIDVTLGLVFFFVILSLVASAVQEWIASVCALRSKNRRSGVENLIGKEIIYNSAVTVPSTLWFAVVCWGRLQYHAARRT